MGRQGDKETGRQGDGERCFVNKYFKVTGYFLLIFRINKKNV